MSEAQEKRGPGNPQWRSGGKSPNPTGRPKGLNKEKKTNRELRNSELLQLVRKFRPLQTKAIQAAVAIIDNEQASESGKLRSAALLIQTYKDLLTTLYDYRYDDDEAEEIQQQNGGGTVFSLRMIDGDKKDE
jgi:hypothetical protein